jgi:hypothetical protein
MFTEAATEISRAASSVGASFAVEDEIKPVTDVTPPVLEIGSGDDIVDGM